jgi:hypothetical protein
MFSLNLLSQPAPEKEIKSDISEVTVFMNGAQITRSKNIEIPSGRSTLKFISLSPYINTKSITVNAKGDLTILSVNQQQNYLTQQDKVQNSEQLTEAKLNLEKKINLEKTYIDVLNEELSFLKANQTVGGTNTGTSITSVKEADDYFTGKITAIKLKEIERQNTIESLTKDLDKITSQLNGTSNKSELPSGEILVQVEAKTATSAAFELKYLVSNAGWLPSYDIRVKNIDLPADLVYKANIHQNTNEEWKNVKLKLSSSDPSSSEMYRDLSTYFLNYNAAPPSYTNFISEVSGHVYDRNTNNPMPGVTISIKGTTIGTISDRNGFYSLQIPPNAGNLLFSFVGCKSQERPIRNGQIDVVMVQGERKLEEVVVVGYGKPKNNIAGALQGQLAGVSTQERKDIVREGSAPVETEQLSNPTNVEFEIKTPYSVPSDGKNLMVEIEKYSLPANYQYYCTPKISKGAFLLAEIVNWEKYNLLEGEANVFFEGTYTGKTILDARYTSDTLSISLGRDKGVTISREIQKQFTTKQFLSNKKEETKSWLIGVKNNKQQPVNLTVTDQIPVSTMEEIEVNPVNLSNGSLEPETGKVKWEFQLKPAEKKEIELKYSVRYPRTKKLIIE